MIRMILSTGKGFHDEEKLGVVVSDKITQVSTFPILHRDRRLRGHGPMQFPCSWPNSCNREHHGVLLWSTWTIVFVTDLQSCIFLYHNGTDARHKQSDLDAAHYQVWSKTSLLELVHSLCCHVNLVRSCPDLRV